MKKTFILTLIISLVLGSITVTAYTPPNAFWDPNEKYEIAVDANDYKSIIKYGQQVVDAIINTEDCYEKWANIVTRTDAVALAYAKIEDYDNAVKTYKKLYEYAINCGYDFADQAQNAKARILQYTSNITMYTDNGVSPFYGAVNEKGNGVLFGMCANGGTRSKLDNESMILTYQELGESLLSYNIGIMKEADKLDCAVEFALNCPRQATDIKNIYNMTSYLKEISNMLKNYPDVPVYLRFAAEFNLWENLPDTEEFKNAFRYVSKYFKNRHDNVAMVWSPNQVSSWDVYLDDYYPGDEYVDWVGVSLYAPRYFLGDKNQPEKNEIAFRTGVNSDPVIAMKDIVETYGDRKPIMISESGCGHKVVKTGEDTTDFALKRLREYYSYLPMVYPQIKLIAYFDWFVEDDTERDDFRLSNNKQLQDEYLRLMKGPRYIQDSYYGQTDYCNRPIYDGIDLDSVFELSCYAHLYNAEVKSVAYFIDGNYVDMATEVPFTTYIDASDYPGTHKLKAIAQFDNGKTLITESKVYIDSPDAPITVEVSGKKISFDQDPVLYNDRTMVPLRKIFEALGATVSWDNDTKTATGKKGGRTVTISVGSKQMYVNNKKYDLDTAPIVVSDRTLVPARAVAEGMGCNVEWNEKNNLVSITPKNYNWSSWTTSLPSGITSDLYEIESRKEYKYRTREEKEVTFDYEMYGYDFVREEVSYGDWSSWTDSYISPSNNREVDTRTISNPKRYHYAHYCTGNISDQDSKYRTRSYWWHDECKYHDLGWFDSPLEYSPDSTSNYAYYVNGERYRCSNTCFRWYLIETSGGDYTEYRSRPIYRQYVYSTWGRWSAWSDWDTYNPYNYYSRFDEGVDVDSRTVYRYKEKG